MKGILIKDMQMPETCAHCRLMVDGWCYAMQAESHYGIRTDGKPEWCPLIALPDGLYQVQGESIWKYHRRGER